MKEETIQKLTAAIDEVAKQVGMEGYEGMIKMIRAYTPITRGVLDLVEILGTPDFAQLLSQKDEPPAEFVEFIVRLIHGVPAMFGGAMREAVQKEFFQAVPKGRHPIDAKKRRAICDFVLELHGKKGVSERVAKERASQKFSVSRRSVHRIWNDRAEILKDSEIAQEVVERFKNLMRPVRTTEKSVSDKPE